MTENTPIEKNATLEKAKEIKHLLEIVEDEIKDSHRDTIKQLASNRLEVIFSNQADPVDVKNVYEYMKRLQSILTQLVARTGRAVQNTQHELYQEPELPQRPTRKPVPDELFGEDYYTDDV